MSSVVKKATFLSGSFFVIALLCSCSDLNNRTPAYNDPFFPKAEVILPSDFSVNVPPQYGTGEDGDVWGPTCPLDGSDLRYHSNGKEIAMSMPYDRDGHIANSPCRQTRNMPAQVPSAVRGYVPMDPQQMMPAYPMPQQYMAPQYVPQQPMVQQPLMPAYPVMPRVPAQTEGRMANSGMVEIPVHGVIGGASHEGYVMLDCQGKYIANSPCNADPNVAAGVGATGIDAGAGVMGQPEMQRYPREGEVSRGNNVNFEEEEDAHLGLIADEEWFADEGVSLRALLQEWADRAGWRVVWNSDREYVIEAGAVFKGKFMDVSSALIRAFARANPAPQGVFYKGNKVLVINTQEAENAE